MAFVKCPHCGFHNRPGAVTCDKCGQSLTSSPAAELPKKKICPFCAEEIQYAAIVCRHCGRDQPATAAATPVVPGALSQPAIKPGAARPHPKRWPWALLGGVAIGVATFYWWGTSSYSVDVDASRRIIQDMESKGQITDRHCAADLGRATVTDLFWSSIPTENTKRNFLLALSALCVDEHKSPQIHLIERRTGRVLAIFDGRNIER